MHEATQHAEPSREESRDLFLEALDALRLDWPDAPRFEERMWQIARLFNDREAVTLESYQMWLLSLYLLAKLMYGPQGADVDAVISKPRETIH